MYQEIQNNISEIISENPRNKIFNFNEYDIPNLAGTVNEILNLVFNKNQLLTSIYLKLHAVIYYYEYAIGALQSFEYFLRLQQTEEVRKGHLIPDAILCANAIASYSFMYSCINILEKALSGFENDEIIKRKLKFAKCKDYIFRIRHRVAAHPEEDNTKENKKFYIMSKRSSISFFDHNQSGSIKIRQVFIENNNISATEKPECFELYPRKHFEELKLYLDDIGILLKRRLIAYCKKLRIAIKKD